MFAKEKNIKTHIREYCVDLESYFLGSLKEREIERRHDVDCFISILKAN